MKYQIFKTIAFLYVALLIQLPASAQAVIANISKGTPPAGTVSTPLSTCPSPCTPAVGAVGGNVVGGNVGSMGGINTNINTGNSIVGPNINNVTSGGTGTGPAKNPLVNPDLLLDTQSKKDVDIRPTIQPIIVSTSKDEAINTDGIRTAQTLEIGSSGIITLGVKK